MDTSWVPLRDPHETAADRVIGLSAAVLVHLGLALALVVSLNWSTPDPEPVQAELWSSLPPEAIPQKAPVATPKPSPKAPTPPEPARDPGPTEAEIALAKKKAAEEAARDKRERAEKEKAAKEKTAKERAAKEKAANEKAQREKAAREKAAQEKAQRAQTQKAVEAQRAAELARLGIDPKAKPVDKGKDTRTKAGVSGGAEQGARSGALATYSDSIRSRIRSRIRFDPARAPENPEAIFEVEQLPTGQISAIRLVKASGRPDWDAAVRRAIEASDPLPKGPDGLVERRLELRFRPMDQRNP